MNGRKVTPADRPFMFQHLEHVNEDATSYPSSDVRTWSEEVCFLVSELELTWDDHYRIDLLRIKFSQNGPGRRDQRDCADTREGGRRTTDVGALDPLTDFSPEVSAAKPNPPCRQFNGTGCSHKTHHVSNGYRQLHVCASCVFHKCLFFPHQERECRSKEFRKKYAAREAEAGFGK